METALMIFAIIAAIIWLLATQYTLIFWLVFVPLGILLVISFIGLLQNKKGKIGDLVTVYIIVAIIIVALLLVVS